MLAVTPHILPSMTFAVESSPLGKIVVADTRGRAALFYTTKDFAGMLTDGALAAIGELLATRFGIRAELATCHQVHGAESVRVDDGSRCEFNPCDALWSAKHNVALGIKVADCLPVTIVDSTHSIIANIHSGWRGTAQKITNGTIERITVDSNFSSASSDVFLGPSIRSCCFEVGEEVVEEFGRSFGGIERHIERRAGGRPHIDLAGLTREVLLERGFPAGSIHDSGLCTRCDDSIFHSFRKDGKQAGRNLAIVAQ